jgi:hypothetical protein
MGIGTPYGYNGEIKRLYDKDDKTPSYITPTFMQNKTLGDIQTFVQDDTSNIRSDKTMANNKKKALKKQTVIVDKNDKKTIEILKEQNINVVEASHSDFVRMKKEAQMSPLKKAGEVAKTVLEPKPISAKSISVASTQDKPAQFKTGNAVIDTILDKDAGVSKDGPTPSLQIGVVKKDGATPSVAEQLKDRVPMLHGRERVKSPTERMIVPAGQYAGPDGDFDGTTVDVKKRKLPNVPTANDGTQQQLGE